MFFQTALRRKLFWRRRMRLSPGKRFIARRFVYGPHPEAIHGFNERVDLESVRRVTKATALFVAE